MINKYYSAIMGLLICSIAHAETAEVAQAVAEEGSSIMSLISILFWPFVFFGLAIYMYKQVQKEKARAWVPLALDGTDNSTVAIRSEFAEYEEWYSQLKEFEVKKDENSEETETCKLVTSWKELNQGFDLLAKLSALPNLNNQEKEVLNGLGEKLNQAQQRYHASSLWARIAIGLVYTLLFGIWPLLGAYLACTAETFAPSTFAFCLLAFASYVAYLVALNYADKRPAYKFATEENSITTILRKSFAYANLKMLCEAEMEFHTKYYIVYKHINGKKWYQIKPFEGVFNAIFIMGILIMLVIPIGCFIIGAVSVLSNYIIKK